MRNAVVMCAALATSMIVVPVATQQGPDPTIAVPGHSSQTPWAATLGEVVAVAFGAQAPSGKADVYVAVSRDAGRHFEEPVRVNVSAGDARLGGELPPRVGLVARAGVGPDIVVAYGARATGTEIRVARSTDGGRSFATSRVLPAPEAPGDRGWHAMMLDASGTAHVMWLDHRGLAAHDAPMAGHHAEPAGHHPEPRHSQQEALDGVAMAQRSGLYYARDGERATAEVELVKGVCYCCKVAMAVTPHGGLLAAWRHVYAGNIRDIAFIFSADGGRQFDPPGRVSEDNWRLAGCPDDGPALAVDVSGAAHIVGPTVIDGPTPEGAIFYASSRDQRSFSPRLRIPTLGGLRPMHPQVIAVGPARLFVAWDEVIDGVRRAAVRSIDVANARPPEFGAARQLGPAGLPAAYPFLVSTPAGPLAVYVSGKPGESVLRVTRL